MGEKEKTIRLRASLYMSLIGILLYFIVNVKNHPSEMGGMISSASLSGGF